ncbi:MAG: hypothetical protein GYB31_17465 [Bacteroidetes bacterium]|nr:hypothetical protein [Bacteroidota bacterium]
MPKWIRISGIIAIFLSVYIYVWTCLLSFFTQRQGTDELTFLNFLLPSLVLIFLSLWGAREFWKKGKSSSHARSRLEVLLIFGLLVYLLIFLWPFFIWVFTGLKNGLIFPVLGLSGLLVSALGLLIKKAVDLFKPERKG